MKKLFTTLGLMSLAFGAGTVYGSIVASGVAFSMCDCEVQS